MVRVCRSNYDGGPPHTHFGRICRLGLQAVPRMPRIHWPHKPRQPTPAVVLCLLLAALLLWRLRSHVGQPASAPATQDAALVVRVIDGDTVELNDGRRVRLLGVDAPELSRDERPAQDGAEESRDWLRQRLEGRTVLLRYSTERLDRYGRTLAWVFTDDGVLINRQLLAAGQARIVTRFGLPADLSSRLHEAAARAQARRLGIWK